LRRAWKGRSRGEAAGLLERYRNSMLASVTVSVSSQSWTGKVAHIFYLSKRSILRRIYIQLVLSVRPERQQSPHPKVKKYGRRVWFTFNIQQEWWRMITGGGPGNSVFLPVPCHNHIELTSTHSPGQALDISCC